MRENPCVLRPAVYCRVMLSVRLRPTAWHRTWKLKPPGPHMANLMSLPATDDSSAGGLARGENGILLLWFKLSFMLRQGGKEMVCVCL